MSKKAKNTEKPQTVKTATPPEEPQSVIQPQPQPQPCDFFPGADMPSAPCATGARLMQSPAAVSHRTETGSLTAVPPRVLEALTGVRGVLSRPEGLLVDAAISAGYTAAVKGGGSKRYISVYAPVPGHRPVRIGSIIVDTRGFIARKGRPGYAINVKDAAGETRVFPLTLDGAKAAIAAMR
jgi:hypothetical protein